MAKNKDNLETINLEELTDLKEVEEALNNENENLEIYSKLRIPKKLRSSFSGNIIELEEGYVKTQFEATDEMVFDEEGVIHEGFIFGAANFAVKAAINDPNVVLVTSNIKFLAPIEMGNIVEFESKKTIGKHIGLSFYTIGQSKTLGIGGVKNFPEGKWFVVEKNFAGNQLFVSQNEDFLLSDLKVRQPKYYILESPLLISYREKPL